MFGFGESDQRELFQAAFRYAFSLTHHQYDAEDLEELVQAQGRLRN